MSGTTFEAILYEEFPTNIAWQTVWDFGIRNPERPLRGTGRSVMKAVFEIRGFYGVEFAMGLFKMLQETVEYTQTT